MSVDNPDTNRHGRPIVLETDTTIEISGAVRGAAAIKDFFKTKQIQKKEQKVTKKDAAKKLDVSVKSVDDKLTKGKLKGDGHGGVTDESVEALAKTKSPLGEPNVELGKQQNRPDLIILDDLKCFEEPEKKPTEDDIPILKTVKEPYVSLADMKKIVAEATQKAYSAGYLDGEEAGRKSIDIIPVASLEEFNGLVGVG